MESITPARNRPIEERFWAKVQRSADITECWIWLACRNPAGYGAFNIGGRAWLAPRVAYLLTYGPFPLELNVLHRCDNPPCCNPHHLFLGTQTENILDMRVKGRGNVGRGSRHRLAKLTDAQVIEIRKRYEQGERVTTIAQAYGVHTRTICSIKSRTTWKHLP